MKWEHRVAPLITLLVVALALSAPFAISLGDRELLCWQLAETDLRLTESATGYAGLSLTLLALVPSLLPRKLRWASTLRRSKTVHIVTGMAVLAVVVVHTCGAWGRNLNAMLLTSLLALVLVALIGKLTENRRMARNPQSAARTRSVWLRVHLFAVGGFVVLLLFHVFFIYYY